MDICDETNSSSALTLEYWEIFVVDGIASFYRSMPKKIIEIHVPELNISINQFQNSINVFLCNKKRYNTDGSDKSSPKLTHTIRISTESHTAQNI